MQPLISVIIPVYNQSSELGLSLDSLQKQTWKNLEVIVVDDGSDVLIEKSGIEDALGETRFELIRQENLGAPAARNKGFEFAKGEFVIFWDADVIAEPDMLEKMYKALKESPEASYAYSNFYFGKKKMPARAFNGGVLKKNNYIATSSLIRRADFPGFDESIKRFQDWDLWLTMLEQGRTGVWINEYLRGVLVNKKGISEWLPSYAYKFPFKFLPGIRGKVKKYEKAKKIVLEKHGL